jgi:RHS repeat-associated protein
VNAQETYTYNKRLQPSMIELGTASNPTADYCLVYNYYSDKSNPTSCATPTQGTKNDGSVVGYFYQDSVQSGFGHTASYTYDNVNRLITAAATGSSTYNLTFGYTADGSNGQYGNMSCVTNGQTNGYCGNFAFSASTNQLTTSGFTYDAGGNLTTDKSNATTHTYQWDAEGRVSSVDSGSTWAFTYNALGERVQWAYSNGAGAYEHMFDPNGGWLGIYGVVDLVRWGYGHFAVYNGSETYFNHINNVSSTSMMTNHAGTAAEDMLFYPWGDVWKSWGSGGYSFAELPYYDTTTNTNLTPFRLFSSNLGRWHSPDPLGGDITNPQSLNRYAYVMNNPTSFVDPSGTKYCKIVQDSEGKESIDLTSCVSDTQYGNNSLDYPGYVQVSQDVTVYVTSSTTPDSSAGSSVTVPSILLTPYALGWQVQQPPPPVSETIGPQPQPPQQQPTPTWEREWLYISCVLNSGAFVNAGGPSDQSLSSNYRAAQALWNRPVPGTSKEASNPPGSWEVPQALAGGASLMPSVPDCTKVARGGR